MPHSFPLLWTLLNHNTINITSNLNLIPQINQNIITNKINNLIHNAKRKITNNAEYDDIDDDTNIEEQFSCAYYTCDEFKKCKFNNKSTFSILHLNIHSLQLHIDELRTFLTLLNFKFDIIAISESKLKNEPQIDINLDGFHPSYCTYPLAEKEGPIHK